MNNNIYKLNYDVLAKVSGGFVTEYFCFNAYGDCIKKRWKVTNETTGDDVRMYSNKARAYAFDKKINKRWNTNKKDRRKWAFLATE